MAQTAARDVFDEFQQARESPFPFLLESLGSGRFTFFGSDPRAVLIAKRDRIHAWKAGQKHVYRADPFEALRETLRQFPSCAAVGWFGYDLGEHIERLPHAAVDDLRFPDLFLGLYDRFTTIDRETGDRRTREGSGTRAVEPDAYGSEFRGLSRPTVPCNFTKASYRTAIGKAKEYIAAGDIYQVNLSQRFEVAGDGPLGVYERLREASPSAYAAYLELGERAILSSSPEQLLEIRGRRVVTRPIKGTRPLGQSQALLESPKDDAELAMIVDLERNDLGRVCEYGTVRVEEPKVLETHPTLHHLSATISGTLRPDADVVDVLRATFPGGSVTGAPKIRAMEIIDELEPTRRGVYTGAIGHLGLDGGVNLSVAIRVLHFDRDRFGFQVGGAIVADSDPEEEYRETLVKAAGIARALGLEWNTSR